MITVTKINQDKLIVNADLIEYAEQIPDTMLTLTTGRKIMVTESLEDIVRLVLAYREKTRADPVPAAVAKKPGKK